MILNELISELLNLKGIYGGQIEVRHYPPFDKHISISAVEVESKNPWEKVIVIK
jgi:hypothetical protein